jgi:STE24 endopeptidase
LLQHKIYQQADKVPEELKDIVNEETYNKARVYGLDKSLFSIVKELFGIITTVVRHYLLKLYRKELET